MELRRRKEVSRTISARPRAPDIFSRSSISHVVQDAARLGRARNMCPRARPRKDPRHRRRVRIGKIRVVAAIMGSAEAQRGAGSSVRFQGTDVTHLSARRMRDYWGTEMAMVFQDPMTSLNPS